MSEKEVDPAFRAFAASRPRKREIWVRIYWGVIIIPVHIMYVLVFVASFAVAAAWVFLTTEARWTSPYVLWLPPAVAYLAAVFAVIRQTEWNW